MGIFHVLKSTNGTKSRKVSLTWYNEASSPGLFSITFNINVKIEMQGTRGKFMSNMDGAFCKNSWRQKGVDFFSKNLILDVWQGPEYASRYIYY